MSNLIYKHQIVKSVGGTHLKQPYYYIAEVVYDDIEPLGWGECIVGGPTIDALRMEYAMMGEAFTNPILVVKDGKVVGEEAL